MRTDKTRDVTQSGGLKSYVANEKAVFSESFLLVSPLAEPCFLGGRTLDLKCSPS